MEGIELVNFIDLSLDEKKMILSWRNHAEVSKWMYTDTQISLDEHLEFIDSLSTNTNKKYFLAKRNESNFAVIDFVEITSEECYYGFYSNPFSEERGIGRILDPLCIEYAFNELGIKTLKLEVFSENIGVVNLHKKFKFKEFDRKTVNGKEVICMKLNKNEL